MQKWALLVLGVVLASGLAMSYGMYRQLGTSNTVTLEASPNFEVNAQGESCADVTFEISARLLGQWMFLVEEGRNVTGVVTVDGSETNDVGVSIWSPTNRPILVRRAPQHEQEFELISTIRGEYRFEFDNRHSVLNSKHVTVSLCVA